LIEEQPEIAAGAVRAIVKAQAALKAEPSRATAIAERLFPPEEVPLIAGLIERDAPFYDATISPEAVEGLNKFTKAAGLIGEAVPYDRLVAAQFSPLWRA
jgi:ABC-type nitrate/sulfonate/bicarbonate transport system substrate-binding protein